MSVELTDTIDAEAAGAEFGGAALEALAALLVDAAMQDAEEAPT